ncbi:MAG: phosphoribosyl-ATP diphosphatase [Ardenticatenaceae bacterium]|nr:phosphoribosyl-ATP diphosphatase [Ardenticatenaceae bacterium]
MNDFMDELFATLRERKNNPTATSYTASLLAAGEDEIVKKIGEEAVEIILAAKGQGDQRVVEESADLIYHLMVLLVSRDLSWDDIRAELKKRHR